MQIIFKKKMLSSQKFCYTFRFMDDQIIINKANFEENIQIIYPAWLELKKGK